MIQECELTQRTKDCLNYQFKYYMILSFFAFTNSLICYCLAIIIVVVLGLKVSTSLFFITLSFLWYALAWFGILKLNKLKMEYNHLFKK